MKLARRIKPTHLRLVIAIADHKKMSLAADHLAVSQPSASRTLSELENLLGHALFFRHPKWMEPTPEGLVVINHGRTIVNELENLELEFDKTAEGSIGSVRIGTVTGPACQFVIPALNTLRAEFPGIEISIEVAPSIELMQGLKTGRFDFVVGRPGPLNDIRQFHTDIAPPEVVALCVGRRHPLSQKKDVALETLANYDWVMQEIGSPIRQAVENTYIANNLTPPAKVTNTSSLLAMLNIMTASNAIAPVSFEVFSMLTSSELNAQIHQINIREDIIVPPAQIVRNVNPPLSRAAEKAFDLVKKELSKISTNSEQI